MRIYSFLLILSILATPLAKGQMVLSGDAVGACDCYTLTSTTNSAGSIWSPTTIDLTKSFDFTFEVNLGSNDGGGADGIVFVLRQSGTSTGGEGSLLGYSGITTSVGVEIDTWNSDPVIAPGDIAADHLGMSADGAVNHGLVPAVGIPNIEDGAFHIFNAVWNPVLTELTINLDGVEIFTYTGDLVTTYFGGDPNVFFGWTGATGGSFNVQQVCMYRNADFTYEPEEPCPGQEVTFTNTSSGDLIYDGEDILTFEWDFDDGETSLEENPTHIFGGEGSKDVVLVVTDISGCTHEIEIGFDVRNLEPAISTSTDANCYGSDDGTATVTIEPIEADYSYAWDDPLDQTTETAINLAPGTYTVTVTNEEGCEGEISVTIEEPDPLIFGENIVVHSSCDADDGSLTLFGIGGTPTYEFSLNGGPFTADNTFEDLGSGLYDIAIQDENGCLFEDTVRLDASGLTLDFIYNEPTCFGFSDGSLTIDSDGAGVGIIFEITNSAGDLLNEDNSNTANSLTTGWYYIFIEDESGCFQSDSVFIDQPGQLDIDLTLFDVLCYGEPTGWARVDSVYNTTGDYEGVAFIWNPNPAGVGGTFADSSYNMTGGNYTLTINDDNGCSQVFDFEIEQPDSLYLSEFGFEPAYCRLHEYQNGNGVVYGAAAGGTADYDYLWTNLETGETINNTTWGGRNPGNYKLTIIDANGCILERTVFLDSLNPIADFSVISSQLNGDLKGSAPIEVQFTNLSQNFANPFNPTADTTFFWNLDHSIAEWQVSHDYFEVFDTTYLEKGQTYTVDVCLVALNKNGCTDTTCKVITIYQPIAFIGVNVFTPNADGINDVFSFEFKSASIAEFSCVILNRWGVKMFEMTDITDSWDGTDKSGDPCKDGVYFYKYEGKTDNGLSVSGQGTVTIVN